jgi:hypothetical protein
MEIAILRGTQCKGDIMNQKTDILESIAVVCYFSEELRNLEMA